MGRGLSALASAFAAVACILDDPFQALGIDKAGLDVQRAFSISMSTQ